jgi:hypothetical protein
MSRFLERLAAGPLVGDGGMGALLASAVPRLRCPEEANIRAPESVVGVHVGYIRAGADVIETNTFGANRPKLAQHFLEEEFEQINNAAVRLAREAREVCGREVFIAGSIGPLGDLELRGQDASSLYAEQATVLEGRGVDLFMIETFYDLDELETAVRAVRSVSQLPVVALMTFDGDGQTLAGVSAADAAERLRALDVAERPDRAGDEDVASRDLARLARELHTRAHDPFELLLEEVLRELRTVRAERVRLDQLGARPDEAEMDVDDALGRAQVRLLRAAQPRYRAREQRAHAAVADDRRARREPFDEARHAPSLPENGERGRRQPRSRSSVTTGAAPAASGPLDGCTMSIASARDLTHPSDSVDAPT